MTSRKQNPSADFDQRDTVALSSSKILAREIGQSDPGECPYVLFLGAGASVTSGISTSYQLTKQWQEEIFCDLFDEPYPIPSGSSLEESFEAWVNNSTTDEELDQEAEIKDDFRIWFERTIGDYEWRSNNLYSALFEYVRQSKEARQSFIEQITSGDGVSPSLGYFYLATLLREKVIECILTTNFDDLVADALFRFYDQRPIVCAFESSINNFNNSSKRPKIVKLHGDYLFNDIRNTDKELVALDVNMENKMIELCQDRGLVFIGYGGADTTIMDPITKQLQVNERFLTKDLHWCVRRSDGKKGNRTRIHRSELPNSVWLLKKRFPTRVHLYEIDGFDFFMSDIVAEADVNSDECFNAVPERNTPQIFIKEFQKFRVGHAPSARMSEDFIKASEYHGERESAVGVCLRRANVLWEVGKELRDNRQRYQDASAKFEESVRVAEDAPIETATEVEKWGLTTRMLGSVIGALKCQIKLDDKSEGEKWAQKVNELLQAGTKDWGSVSSKESELDEYISTLYNGFCGAAVASTASYLDPTVALEHCQMCKKLLERNKIGRAKLKKLETDADAVEMLEMIKNNGKRQQKVDKG